MRSFLTLQGIAILITFGAIVFFFAWIMGRCDQSNQIDTSDEGFVADTFTTDQVEEFLPDPDPGFFEGTIRHRNRPATKIGRFTDDKVRDRLDEYVKRASASAEARTIGAMDTLAPWFPDVRVRTRKDRGVDLGVTRSDGVYETRSFPDCRHPCEAGTRDSTFYAREERQIPGITLFKDMAICGAAAGIAAGMAFAASYEHPEYAAAGVGAGCAVLQIVK